MEVMNWMESLHPESPIREYLRWMNQSGNDLLYKEKYEQIVREQKEQGKIFLTVVLRTQGKRMEMLQDVLTCLQAQSDPDFETVIICHRTSKEACEAVRSMVAAQIPEFADRTRVIQSDEGERGAPLNLGFACARGRYAVCLDDDDLVLDHWVRVFHEAEKTHQGMILHAYAVTQKWQSVVDEKTHRQMLSAAGSPDPKYCVPYRTLGQQAENSCPFMGLAFPLFLFRELHVLFNETLSTTEDWDYLMRTAGIAGISETGEVTAIYRLWNTKDTSRQLIQEPEWNVNYREIGQKMQPLPLLLTAYEAALCREELTGLQSAGQKGRSCFMRVSILFWSNGEPFTDRQHTMAPVAMKDGWIRTCFAMKDLLKGKQITRIRFDPSEETLFALDHITVRLIKDGKVIEKLENMDIRETNGLVDGDTILFLSEDPVIILDTRKPESPDEVEVTARVFYRSPEVLVRWEAALCADARWLSDNRKTARLFMDYGEGFQEKDCIACVGVLDGEDYQAAFDFPPDQGSGIQQLRFDPTEVGMCWLSELKIQVFYENGDVETLNAEQTEPTTGFRIGDGLAFIDPDPHLMIPVRPDDRVHRITVTGKINWVEADRMEDLFAQADMVPNYELVFGQLERMRQNQRKEEALLR